MTELRPLTNQLHPTVRRLSDPGGRTRHECWSATTVDGLWGFERLEEPGTPWAVYYKPGTPDQELCSTWFTTLNKARLAVERGQVKTPSQWTAEHASGGHDRRWDDCPTCTRPHPKETP